MSEKIENTSRSGITADRDAGVAGVFAQLCSMTDSDFAEVASGEWCEDFKNAIIGEMGKLIDARLQSEAAWKAREAALVEALQDVVNPLAHLRRYAEARGNKLGAQAYSIANNLAFVQGIAREALARAKTTADAEGQDHA